MKATRERDIQSQCLQYLSLNGIFAWRQNSGAFAGQYNGKKRFVRFCSVKGVSDILGILPGGRFLAVEVKRPGETPTFDQQCFLGQVAAAGGLGVVVKSVDELMAALGV